MTPKQILNHILGTKDSERNTYIITGKPGRTGKTWLTEKLKEQGYNAFEISEHIYDKVSYIENSNAYIDDMAGTVLIILNVIY